MKNKIISFLIEISYYKKTWKIGIILLMILGIFGVISHIKEYNLTILYLLIVWPLISICLWTALILSNSRIIKANDIVKKIRR